MATGLGAALGGAIGCTPQNGGTGGGNSGPITLKWWDNQQSESGLSEYQQAAVAQFTEAHPDIKVEVTTVPYDQYQQRLQLAVQGGDAPDVATVDQIWTAGLAAGESILPLDDMIGETKISHDSFFPGAWESALVDGKLFGVPFNVDVWQFTYANKKLLADAGVELEALTNWSGLTELGEAMASSQVAPIGLFGSNYESTVCVMDSFIYSNGGSILDDQGRSALHQPAAVEALRFLHSLVPFAPDGVLNNTNEKIRELFLNQTVATEWWPALEQPTLADSDLDWDFVAGSAPDGQTPIGTYGGWNLALFASDDDARKEAAMTFIDFLVSPEVNGKVVDLIPGNVAAAESFLQENRLNPEVIMTHLENARPRPLSPKYLDVSLIQQEMFQKILNGTEVQAAADEASQRIDGLA
ncbi:extracellular solute-binding protein [Propionibacteriaceae bacterium Y2011]